MFQTAATIKTIAQGVVTLAKDPERTEAVFTIAEALERRAPRMVRKIRALSPDIDRLVSEHYQNGTIDLVALQKLPAGTLGRAFADHMLSNNLAVEFYPKIEVTDDNTYLLMRLRQTHDIWHTVTGFGTDPVEELGLQAFMLAQLGALLPAILIGAGLVRTLFEPALQRQLIAAVRRGYRLGRRSRPLLAARWEDGWHRPLAEWRKELGLPS